MGEKNLESLLTTAEVAEWLNLSIDQVKFYTKQREIPSLKLGKHRRFSKKALEKWLLSKIEG